MEGTEVSGTGSEAPPLALGVRQAAVSGVCHQFNWCCKGGGLFVSVQHNNHNTLISLSGIEFAVVYILC